MGFALLWCAYLLLYDGISFDATLLARTAATAAFAPLVGSEVAARFVCLARHTHTQIVLRELRPRWHALEHATGAPRYVWRPGHQIDENACRIGEVVEGLKACCGIGGRLECNDKRCGVALSARDTHRCTRTNTRNLLILEEVQGKVSLLFRSAENDGHVWRRFRTRRTLSPHSYFDVRRLGYHAQLGLICAGVHPRPAHGTGWHLPEARHHRVEVAKELFFDALHCVYQVYLAADGLVNIVPHRKLVRDTRTILRA